MSETISTPAPQFAEALLHWFETHGRKTLPWQHGNDPYSIWVSEIMLQQTQVETVIPYYNKFMARFPDVRTLAEAEHDEVMKYWAGLGYYARARNLHRASRVIMDQHNGVFPLLFKDVVALPGIGRSTAGAILCFSDGQRHPILDGNVKRVLSRYYAIAAYPGKKQTENLLWQLADSLTPDNNTREYTQAIMDLGATLCTRSKPQCGRCPVGKSCRGLASGNPETYPAPKPRIERPKHFTRMLVIQNQHCELLLIKRPPKGIWGGLWVLPEIPQDVEEVESWSELELGLAIEYESSLNLVRHGFTHYALDIQPVMYRLKGHVANVMDAAAYLWYNPNCSGSVALPAAMGKIFRQLRA